MYSNVPPLVDGNYLYQTEDESWHAAELVMFDGEMVIRESSGSYPVKDLVGVQQWYGPTIPAERESLKRQILDLEILLRRALSINLADGPPTEPGWYWYCREDTEFWHIVQIERRDNGTLRQSSIWYWDSNLTTPGRWSTRLPDPPGNEAVVVDPEDRRHKELKSQALRLIAWRFETEAGFHPIGSPAHQAKVYEAVCAALVGYENAKKSGSLSISSP